MSELNYRTELGHLHVQGWRAPLMEAAAELGRELARAGERVARAATLCGERVWIKGGPLRGRARLRHALRAQLFRARAPRIQEYFNHSWMIERHFQCALPLAAGVFTRGGAPHYQYFVSAEIAGARPLLDVLEGDPRAPRAALLEELAREVARLHALGFLHHDLHLRNFLVTDDTDRALHILDAWRGGPPPQLRPLAYDLACLFLDGARVLGAAEQQHFLERYLHHRAAQGRPTDPARLLRTTVRLRGRLHAQLLSDPGRRHGHPMPPDWNPFVPSRSNP